MSLRGRLWPSLSTLCSHLARGGQRIQKDVYNTKGYYVRGEGALSVLLCSFLGLPTSLLHGGWGERFHWTELQLWGPAVSEAFLCKEPYNKQPPPVLVKGGLTSLVVKLFFFAYWSQSILSVSCLTEVTHVICYSVIKSAFRRFGGLYSTSQTEQFIKRCHFWWNCTYKACFFSKKLNDLLKVKH